MSYTIKQIEAMYKGKRYNERDMFSTITKIVNSEYRDGRKISILCSGEFMRDQSGYSIEAIIDRSDGKNLIPERARPAQNTTDIIDVAWEMLDDEFDDELG